MDNPDLQLLVQELVALRRVLNEMRIELIRLRVRLERDGRFQVEL